MKGMQVHGWAAGAAVLLLVVGLFHVIQGLVALVQTEFFVVGAGQLIVMDFTAWGWGLLIGGIVLALAGVAVFTGQMWARSAGIFLAAVSMLAQLVFLVAFPLWSLAMVAINVVIIYGLTAGWTQLAANRGAAGSAYGAGRSDAQYTEGKHAMTQQPQQPQQSQQSQQSREASMTSSGEPAAEAGTEGIPGGGTRPLGGHPS